MSSHIVFYRTRKSRLKYEIKYDLYKIAQKYKNTANLKLGHFRIFGF